jgi:hypothetical protein
MPELALVDVVRVALLELKRDGRYTILDASFVNDGWCALLRSDGAESAVHVPTDPLAPLVLRPAVESFKRQMRLHGLV